MIKSKFVSEFLGTFALVFFGCGGVLAAQSGAIPGAVVPLLFGGAICIMIYAVGHISGGNFNPAVSLGLVLAKRMPRGDLVYYWIAQILGAIVAALLLKLSLGGSMDATVTQLSSSTSILNGFLWEVILTFFLVFVVIGVATDLRSVTSMAGFSIGLTIILDAFVGGSYTGGSMNPARSIGPALIAGNFNTLWLYILAPLCGGALAAFCYEAIRGEGKEVKSSKR